MKYIKLFENKKKLEDFAVNDSEKIDSNTTIKGSFYLHTPLYTEVLSSKEISLIKQYLPDINKFQKTDGNILYYLSNKNNKCVSINKHDDFFYFSVTFFYKIATYKAKNISGIYYYKCDQLNELKIFLTLLNNKND